MGTGRSRQRGLGHQVHILAAHRRKHAVVRMDGRARTQRRHRHALAAPFVGAHDAQQLAQRLHIVRRYRAVCLQAGGPHIGRAAQRQAVVGVERQQQATQQAGTLALRLALRRKGLGQRGGGTGRARQPLVQSATQGLQQVAGVLVVAHPQQGGAGVQQAVGGVGRQGVVGQLHSGRWRVAGQAAPAGLLRHTVVGPVHLRRGQGGVLQGGQGRRGGRQPGGHIGRRGAWG